MSNDNSVMLQIHPAKTSGGPARRRISTNIPSLLGYLPRVYALFVCSLCLTCSPDCDLSNQDQAFKVTILKGRSDFSCEQPADADPLIGQSFTIFINDRAPGRGGDCGCGAGPILESPTTVTWSNAVPQKTDCAGPMYAVTMDVNHGECTTQATLSLFATGPTTGADPNNTGAQLQYGDAECLCTRLYSVAIERVAAPE